MSPPTCVSGNKALAASRTNLRRTAARSRKRPLAGNSNHQPAPATETVAARVRTTNGIPQPTLATAFPTASMPDHAVRPMQAAIPAHQATTPTCFSASKCTLVLNAAIDYRPSQRPACRLRQIVEANRETNRSRPDQFRRTRNWSTRCACRTPPTNTNPMPASDSPISDEGEQCGWFQNGQVSEILRRGEALGTHQGQTAASVIGSRTGAKLMHPWVIAGAVDD